jgi:hypothetical protein
MKNLATARKCLTYISQSLNPDDVVGRILRAFQCFLTMAMEDRRIDDLVSPFSSSFHVP